MLEDVVEDHRQSDGHPDRDRERTRVPGPEVPDEHGDVLREDGARAEAVGDALEDGADGERHVFDQIVLATGVTPRLPEFDGVDHPSVLSYLEVVRDKAPVGTSVAILGAGGIGFDVAEYLTAHGTSASLVPEKFFREWGIDPDYAQAGGITDAAPPRPDRRVALFQRKSSKVGAGLGKTTGWIHRTELKAKGVQMVPGVEYQKIDDAGLHLRVNGADTVLPVDNVILCTGQEPQRELLAGLEAGGAVVHLIGGADVAAELDAKRAIDQGTRLAARL